MSTMKTKPACIWLFPAWFFFHSLIKLPCGWRTAMLRAKKHKSAIMWFYCIQSRPTPEKTHIHVWMCTCTCANGAFVCLHHSGVFLLKITDGYLPQSPENSEEESRNRKSIYFTEFEWPTRIKEKTWSEYLWVCVCVDTEYMVASALMIPYFTHNNLIVLGDKSSFLQSGLQWWMEL